MKLKIELELNDEFPNRYLGAIHVIEQSIRAQYNLIRKPESGDGGPLVDGAGGTFGRWEVVEESTQPAVPQPEAKPMTKAEKIAAHLAEHCKAATVALAAYGATQYPKDDPIEFYWASDLMADLRHLADREAWDWDELIAKAERHYQAEVDGEDEDDDDVATPTAPEQAIAVFPSKGKDAFLDDATHELRNMWELRGGATLGEHELDALNDVLTAFFADKEL